MEKKGSGVTYYKTSHSDEMQIFKGGLRAPTTGQIRLELGKDQVDNHHEILEYERGTIMHSRNPNSRMLNFHYLYGGVQKYWFQRYIYQNAYKRYIRAIWAPCLFVFTLELIGMRMYDNNAYDYFYFSD
jgi:hypothetical protein